ncbi:MULTISPECIES: nitroreductase family protein [Clostridium]|uniref:Putative NAD(P)H nitroreductase MhqN n=1 Tax=Clostridium saccharoperbutylacetonicum N1-4(HMT) TaxID=931276 RepID=M1N3I9_9CLOT|nr:MULTISPECIES: nitroreductase family protein [Clostridium]AGF58032.1 putative NAD(P)H nitroreductase MhqN [Clostridium saccharoperbutylacetonicum N1-4(HMT)]AQR96712.1 putative NAD(P)H nitroreductase MhqN [Clostridium saccharoperbutylacetonicum]NRT61194.1 putative NAD(P)H nitroreductase [Clostridium saccharoperbutylacetonicum]NSB24511.1 putative NAD(P)H nitroreductase [Clostridium saccharoperbutylacetonicum]NSB32589.1 putative NAD(P)H nitroreductase [Clostridium saccharoperbutylacetonicum]
MNEFLKIVRERRSADKFIENIKIPREDFNDIFRELSLAPSAFNLQHARYYVVEDKDLQEKVYDSAFQQYKIKTASAVIIVTGDKNAYLSADKIYEGSMMLGMLDRTQYNIMIDTIKNLYEGWGENFKHDEAIRNACLSAMMFLLLAKDKDWDTCPMIYFEKDKISELLNIPDNEVPALMITMGKMDKSSTKIRGYRKPIDEFVKFF